MKKLFFVTLLVALMLSLSLSVVSAGMDMEDPVLCVAGKWLVVNAAEESGVHVVLPRGTPHGAQGGCTTPAPGPVFVKDVVMEIGHGHMMLVTVDGRKASQPNVVVSYSTDSHTKKNSGRTPLIFVFDLR